VQVVVDGGVALLTLDRPEARNAYTGRMGAELGAAFRRCDEDDDIRVAVVTGTPPAFCAGADLDPEGTTFDRPSGAEFTAAGVDPPAWEVRKPVIAAVNGHAIGIGLTLALQSDVRLFGAEGRYGVVQVRRGVMPDAYAHWTLPRIAGLANAADILLTGRTFDGVEAERLGLGRCLPAADVLPAAMALAADIVANTAPLSVAVSKRLLWEAMGLPPDEVGRRETALHLHLMGRPDAREGVLAFFERRPPVWTGRVSEEWPG